MLEDIAVLTTGTMIAEDLGIEARERDSSDARQGQARAHRERKHDDHREGAGKKQDDEGRIAQIKAQIEETTSDYDKEKLQERLAETCRRGRRDPRRRFDRGRGQGKEGSRSTMRCTRRRAAVEEGIVPGERRAKQLLPRPRPRSASSATRMPTSRPASTSCSGRSRLVRSARSPRTQASRARSWSARSRRTSLRLTGSTCPDRAICRRDETPRQARRLAKVVRRRAAGRRGQSPLITMITSRRCRMVAETPKKEGGPSHARRRDGRYGLLIN